MHRQPTTALVVRVVPKMAVSSKNTALPTSALFFGCAVRFSQPMIKGLDPFGDASAEVLELQRRLATLTQALSEKAEENLDLQREVAVAKSKG